MRTLTLFALSLAGTAVLAGDALAFGKKRGNGCNGGCYGGYGGGCYGGPSYGGYSPGHGGCYGSVSSGGYGLGGYSYQNTYGSGYHTASYPITSSGGLVADAIQSSAATSQASVVRGTDGQTYYLGRDGSYYASSFGAVTTSGTALTYPTYGAIPGPYPGTYTTHPGTYTYPGMYRGTTSYYTPSNPYAIYPAGYYGSYPGGVIPAGGTPPLTMPGVNIGPSGITINPGIPGISPRRP